MSDMVWVPREPTPKMIDATFNDPIETNGGIESHNTRNTRIWNAMIAAAPQQSVDDAMVERAARTVCEITGESWDAIGDFTRQVLIDTQRAALSSALEGRGK